MMWRIVNEQKRKFAVEEINTIVIFVLVLVGYNFKEHI